jgi:hypothetical protein
MRVDNVSGLLLDGVNVPTRLTLKDVVDATVRHSSALTLQVSGAPSRRIRVLDTEGTLETDAEAAKGAMARH